MAKKKEKGKGNEQAILEKLKAHLDAGHPLRELQGLDETE